MTTYYVGKAGDNANAGTSAGSGNEWLTIAYAFTQMAAGDTLWIGDGTYTDSFDAMTSQRPYRKKMDVQTALAELKKCLNSQFDNNIMLVLCRVLDKEIKGELPEPEILPNLDKNSDLSIISSLLEGIIAELSATQSPA